MPSPIPSAWPAQSYVTAVRRAVNDFLSVEKYGNTLTGVSGHDDQVTAAGLTTNLSTLTVIDRKLKITSSTTGPAGVGTYKVTGIAGTNKLTLSPTIPLDLGFVSTDPAYTFELETAVSRYCRRMHFLERTENLPGLPTQHELPMLVCVCDGADEATSPFPQKNEIDIRIHFELAASGPQRDDIEYLYCLVRDRLLRGRNEKFGIGGNGVGLQSAWLLAPTYTPMQEAGNDEQTNKAQASGFFWKCDFDLMCKISREIDAAA